MVPRRRACRRAGFHSSHPFSVLGSMAYTLIGGTAVGTVMILLFLPALYAAWFRIKPTEYESQGKLTEQLEFQTVMAAE